jgi:type IV secretory pathway VirB6-like protein
VSRQATLVGRIGTVLISVGLALLLVSLIPAGQQGYPSSGEQYLAASNFNYAGYFLYLNPQRGIHVNITTDRELRVYVFGNNSMYVMNWIYSHLPDPNNFTRVADTFMLDALLGNNTNLIEYQINVTGQAEFDYTPSEVEEATLIFANYGSEPAQYKYEVTIVSTIAPVAKLQITAAVTIPIGLVLAAPWIIGKTREKRQSTTKKND